jgi:hypothetical protein
MPMTLLANGRCGCTSNAACVGNAAGPMCNLTTNTCGKCTPGAAGDAACLAASTATPYCSAAGACVACTLNANCKNARAPICSPAGACVPCGMAPSASACITLSEATPVCLTSGDFAGACAACAPGGSTLDSCGRGKCFSAQPNVPPVCNQCATTDDCRTILGETCTFSTRNNRFECSGLLNPRQ